MLTVLCVSDPYRCTSVIEMCVSGLVYLCCSWLGRLSRLNCPQSQSVIPVFSFVVSVFSLLFCQTRIWATFIFHVAPAVAPLCTYNKNPISLSIHFPAAQLVFSLTVINEVFHCTLHDLYNKSCALLKANLTRFSMRWFFFHCMIENCWINLPFSSCVISLLYRLRR